MHLYKNLKNIVLFKHKTDADLYLAGGADPLSWPEKAERTPVEQILKWADLDNDNKMNMVRICRMCAHVYQAYVHYSISYAVFMDFVLSIVG